MKPHIRIKLKESAAEELPHWLEVIEDPSLAQFSLHPAIDKILRANRVPFIATREYRPRQGDWCDAERSAKLDRVYRLILRENTRIPDGLIEAISLVPIVEEVNAGDIGEVPLPPAHSMTLSKSTDRESRDAIYLHEAHQYSAGDPNVSIAVLDTGLSQQHPELESALLPGIDTVDVIDGATRFFGDYLDADEDPEDDVGHGTHVAGIIAGKGRNMPVGVAPRCKILPVRVLAAMIRDGKRVGAGLVENINFGVKWAIDNGADVINMSLGVRHTGGGLPHQEVVDYARRMNVSIVAASGNDGTGQLYYPGALPGVIAVGAANGRGEVASFSTFGPHVSMIAPGEEIYSCYLDGGYAYSTGTSHAAPFVAGAAALLKSFALRRGKNLKDSHIKHLLKHTSDKIDQRFKHPKAGFGRLNLSDAFRLADSKLS